MPSNKYAGLHYIESLPYKISDHCKVTCLIFAAIHNYSQLHESSPPGSIGINIGELLEVLSESDHWYFGRRICRNPEEKGIFPKNYVNIRDCSVDRYVSILFIYLFVL